MGGTLIEVTLRPMIEDDADLVYTWQTPEVRKNCRNPQVPSYEGHVQWCKPKDGLDRYIINAGEDCGLLQIHLDEEEPEISVLVAPAYQGNGIGTEAIQEALKRYNLHSALENVYFSAPHVSPPFFAPNWC